MNDEHFDQYLWDRSGEPDEELRALETLLERYRFEHAWPAATDRQDVKPEEEPRR